MIKILPTATFFSLRRLLLVGLLVFWCGVSWGQTTTIAAGTSENASSITAGNNIIMNSGSILNMDVSRTFETLTVRNNNTNSSQFSTIQGSGIATFSIITVSATSPGGSNSSRAITWRVSSETTVIGTSLTSAGSRSKSATIQGTLKLSDSAPITGVWANFSFDSNSTIEYNGAAQSVFIGSTDYHNLILSGSGVKTLPSSIDVIEGNLILSGTASTSLLAGIAIGGNMIIGSGSTLTLFNNIPSLTLGGDATISGTVISPGSAKTIGGDLTINSGGSWTENGSSPAYTIGGSITNYGTFTSGGGLYTLSGSSKSLNGNISLANTDIIGSYTNTGILSVTSALGGTGSLIQGENAVLNLSGTSLISILDASTNCINTVNYNGASQTIKGVNYCNLTLSGSGTKTLQSATTSIAGNFESSGNSSISAVNGLSIGGNVTIGSGSTFTAGAFTHTVGGNWSQTGTFIPGTIGTVNFGGTTNGAIGGGDFANISFTGSGTKTINGILSVSGNITPVSTPVVLSGTNTLTLNSAKTMEILSSGSLTTGSGKLILKPGAIYVNRSSSNPSLEIQQTITGNKGWRMIGTPFTTAYSNLTAGFETQGFSGATNSTLQPNLLWWDETNQGTTLQAWRQPSNITANAPAGRGHYFYVFNGDSKPAPATGNYSDVLPITMSVTGSEVNLASGTFTFPVTYTSRDSNLVAQVDTLTEVNQADEGFNLLANPTASTIDFHAASGWTKTNIDETIYVWDPTSESFLTWNGLTGSLGSGRIAPFQAFWVKANTASPALQISSNTVKSLVSTDFYGRKLEDSPFKIDLHLSGEGLEAKSFISFDPNGKEGADPKDAYQLESLAEDWLLLYTYGSIKTKSPLVINNLPDLGPEEKVIPLHLAASKKGEAISGSYLMDWKLPAEWPADVEIVLMDHIQKKAIDMRKESMHSFSYQAPEIPSAGARKSQGEFTAPKAVIFQSPFESGEVNTRTVNSSKLQRPFTIYIGSFPEDRIEYLPDFPKLFAPVPNPFSDQTKISFYLPVAEIAEVLIYDMLGKSVENFPAAEYQEGIQELVWTPSAVELPSGMYMIRLVTKTHSFTQKLIKN